MELERSREESYTTETHRSPSTGALQSSAPRRYRPSFTGSAGEYFRIWIVNTFLTILTLGLYAAWAKVRNRQYFYKNTTLDGHSFDYTANPLAIFKGYLIIGTGILLYYLSEAYDHRVSMVLLVLFYITFPFLIYKSLRFFAHNSAYRNIRFRFAGTAGNSYRTYLLYPFLIPFTLGLIYPYWAFQKKKYFFDNMGYGTSSNSFAGRPGPFYKVYLIAILIAFVLFFIVAMGMGVFVQPFAQSFGKESMGKMMVVFFMLVLYPLMLIVATFFQQYIYAWTTNYSWGHSKLGKVRFESTLQAGKLVWIRISNILAIIVSLGLLAPWARVRRTRYVLDNLTVITEQSLNDFASAVEPEEKAYGDAATDFFDLEIGL